MKERLQVYYNPEVDVKVNALVEHFDEIGKGKRGYTTDKLKECLKVYQILSERCGTTEPMDVLLHYIDGSESRRLPREENRGLHKVNDAIAEKEKVSEEVDNGVVDLLGDGGEFEFGENI
ncbi:hypothetical protein [Bacillus toyonensis]|uniref:hypothetical protein n=1 Tax=Bacillus toyonensis TaxID=155322 RepID=UPI000BF08E19|nr:hypothetical protein [Bacillus toyonensis]PEK76410.1 hypothetical protein CN594_28395 [Bacillus toyonensis]PFY28511.1 hypothetical protein COL55_34645 [Bacillus toyonensis]PFY33617.1 hypothetical protein COL54_30920 [Bacillus toyonensis]PFY54309.1 hypothetical protein COL62_34480 [Bacillus toyonensis]PGD08352.1 hypothetical protein COM37_31855 [Bacillus toyonensis]